MLLPVVTSVDALANPIGLFTTYEMALDHPGELVNPFDYDEVELLAEFHAPSGKTYRQSGFYDGDGSGGRGTLWKVRFAPDEVGTWHYELAWRGTDQIAKKGTIVVDGSLPQAARGHVKVDPQHPRYLVHADGSPHYWWGGKWISAMDYGPPVKHGTKNLAYSKKLATNVGHKTNQQLLAYLDLLQSYGHNGILLKIALFPLEDDGLSWDLAWIRRGEWLVAEALDRGIYVQVNFFDTWSRAKGKPFANHTNGDKQIFDVWEPDFLWFSDKPLIKNYIRTVVARFSGFANVYWELGNEMEHRPNCGPCFAAAAREFYLPWIRASDPYDLPIGLSEGIWQDVPVDIGFLHQTNELPEPAWTKPVIMNELVRGGVAKRLWRDDAMRAAEERIAFRRTFWSMFTYGGAGSSQATWLDLEKPMNGPVLDVMRDQQVLRDFLESLPVNINQMLTETRTVVRGPGRYSTRSKAGEAYVTYFLLDPGQSVRSGDVTLQIPRGEFELSWIDPKNGMTVDRQRAQSAGNVLTVEHPEINEDIVLLVLPARSTRL